MDGPSMLLAQFAAGFDPRHLPSSTVVAAKRALLDGIGVMLAASGLSEDVAPFINLAVEAGQGPSTILGIGKTMAPAQAAFANGAMAHALDFEDAYDPAPCHPNAALIPAMLAVAEASGPVSGADLLAAVAVGCEISCRLARAVGQPLEAGGWYPPPIFGGFGAVAAAGRILRLDARQMADAFSLMLLQTCPGEIKYAPDTILRAVREAFPARAAVEAALLAQRGVRGFDRPFEGEAGFFRLYSGGQFDADQLIGRLGEDFLVEHLSFKRWPACRGTHAYIEIAQRLRTAIGEDCTRIAGIVIEGGPDQVMLANPPATKQRPSTAIDAKFSLPFTVATALVHGDVTLASFNASALADESVLAFAARTRFVQREDWTRAHAASGRLRILLQDGRWLEQEQMVALGSPRRPLSEAELAAKFVSCAAAAAHSWDEARSVAFIAAMGSIDQAGDALAVLKLG
jgi:2-methylcitrate dehydratase PrpD